MLKNMFKKKKVPEVTGTSARIITIQSVEDWNPVNIEGYLTDSPINKDSKLIRHQDEWQEPVNKFFTKK